MVVTTENKKKSRGFLSGLNQLRVGDYKIAVTEIKAALGIGKSSVSCPLKPSDSAPLKHSTMPP